jgi:hypothetical protein
MIVALAGAALMAFCAYAFSAPIDASNVIIARLADLRTCGLLLGLGGIVGGALFWLCAK